LRQVQKEARENVLDHSEYHHFSKCLDGDSRHVLFDLKTRGKDRGYTERREQVSTSVPAEKMSTDQLKALLWKQIREGVVDAEFSELDEEDKGCLLNTLCDNEEQRRVTRLALETGTRLSEEPSARDCGAGTS
jgi:hypothetical protein